MQKHTYLTTVVAATGTNAADAAAATTGAADAAADVFAATDVVPDAATTVTLSSIVSIWKCWSTSIHSSSGEWWW